MDLVVLLVRLSDLEAAHPELSSATSDSTATSSIAQFLCGLERYDAVPNAAPLMLLVCPSAPSAAAKFAALERELQRSVETLRNVHMQPSEQLLALFEQQYTTPFYDAVNDMRQHAPYTQAMLNVLGLAICRQICRLFRPPHRKKKVIVLDCDNTLWGGAVAEVGAEGIELAPRFLALQRFVVAKQQQGILLALCSKNIYDDVAQAFRIRREEMVLRLDQHVVACKINWCSKSENIAALADELSLGLDSFVFVDDNPLECDEVATALPAVTVINVGPDFSTHFLDHEWVFDEGFSVDGAVGSTKEDSKRTQLYRENRQRQQLRDSSLSHKAFLSALGVRIVFEELDPTTEQLEKSAAFTRVLQLHHRTNQFNTATTFAKRLEEGELLEYIRSPGHAAFCAHVTDRFGHYGLVSAVLCRAAGGVLRVDSFLLSCRALNRGVEHAMLRKLGEIAAKTGSKSLEITWEPTERNLPTHALFSQLPRVVFTSSSHPDIKVFGKEKQLQSASEAGLWSISAVQASEVAFLKSYDSSKCSSNDTNLFMRLLFRIVPVARLGAAALSAIKWVVSSVMPLWIAQLLSPLRPKPRIRTNCAGLLRVSLRDRGSLEQFVRPKLCEISSMRGVLSASGDGTEANEDDKFRRKARHQTKLALVDHLHEEAAQVIWSANRPLVGRTQAADDVQSPAEGHFAGNLQLVCQSPQCASVIQRDSRCAFQRCRNCCYRVQRLLSRALHHGNSNARQSAVKELLANFEIDIAQVTDQNEQQSSDTKWCTAHQNARRRGEICRGNP